MNNTKTLAIVAIFMAATLVVGTFAAMATTQTAVAYQQKKRGGSQDGGGSKNGNTVTIEECKNKGSASGFDTTTNQECENTICTHPGNNATCIQEAFVPSSANLVVCKVVKRDITANGITDPASAFILQVTGNNPSPNSFRGSPPPTCTTVTLGPGGYQVTEVAAIPATGEDAAFCNGIGAGSNADIIQGDPGRSLNLHNIYCVNFSQGCSGTIAVGQTKTCTVTNTAVDIG